MAAACLAFGISSANADTQPPSTEPSPSAVQPTTAPQADLKPETVPPDKYILSLTPVESGPGIVVGAPVPSTKPDWSQADFATGCSFWLQVTIGGLPAFDKTPAYREIDRMREAVLNRPTVAFAPAEAAKVAKMLGVPYLVTTSILGSGALEYTLRTADGSPVGQPIILNGTAKEQLASLPDTAREIVKRIGTGKLLDNLTVDLSVGEMTSIGKGLRDEELLREIEDVIALHRISLHSPMGGLVLVDKNVYDDKLLDTLLTQFNGNVTVLKEVSRRRQNAGIEAMADKMLATEPRNYQLIWTKMNQVQSRDLGQYRKLMESGVETNPLNTFAWSSLGDIIGDEADHVRKARFYGQMSDAESAYVDSKYPLWVAVFKHAAAVDSDNPLIYLELAKAQTFAGDSAAADKAMQTALKVDPHDRNVYMWALEMYAPKWSGNVHGLVAAAKAFENDTSFDNDYNSILRGIYDNDEPEVESFRKHTTGEIISDYADSQSITLWTRALASKKDVDDWIALSNRLREIEFHIIDGRDYKFLNSTEQKVANGLLRASGYAANKAVERGPKNAQAWITVGWNHSDRRGEAIDKAIKLGGADPAIYTDVFDLMRPNWHYSPSALASTIRVLMTHPAIFRDQSANALRVIELTLAATPSSYEKDDEGLNDLKSLLPAVQHEFDALAAHPTQSVYAVRGLIDYYHHKEDWAKADAACTTWLRLDPRNPRAWYLSGYHKQTLKDYDGAVPLYAKALDIDPKLTHAGLKLIAIYLYKKQYLEARKLAYEIAYTNSPYRAYVFVQFGDSWYNSNRVQAMEAWLGAVRLDPGGVDGGKEARDKIIHELFYNQ